MPRTTKQRMLFATIGVLLMVTVMSMFNKAFEAGGMGWALFAQWPMAFVLRAPLAFVLQVFVVQKAVGKRTARYQCSNPIEFYAIRAGFTVMWMAPIMSLYSTVLYVGFVPEFIPIWITKLSVNWLFAFCSQVFVIGPLNRGLYRRIARLPKPESE
ncbi:MAG: DUF2798 domain-containing protein [Propionibacteriaceae bacterium]|nr:DUF2798 domain-containing protein [Propionibacteriaceae bacterium]